MDIWELLLTPLYIGLIFLLAKALEKRLTTPQNKKFYYWGLSAKLFGAFFFVMIYMFYYGFGDTFTYWRGGQVIASAIWENPKAFFEMLTLRAEDYTNNTFHYTGNILYFRAQSTWTLTQIVGLVEVFTFQYYLPTNLLFGFISFLGSWKLYQAFIDIHPKLINQLAWGMLFIPSCIFWSSGILKESITCASIGFFTYYSFRLLYHKKNITKSIVICFISFWLIKDIKSVTIYTYLIGLIAWWYLYIQGQFIKNSILKVTLASILIVLISGGILLVQNSIINEIQNDIAFEKIQETVKGFHSDHGTRVKGHTGDEASTYHLECAGDYTLKGMIMCLPESINVTLFRPYLWESSKITLLFSALESSLFLLLTIFALYKIRGKLLLYMIKYPEITLSLIFTIMFGFIVGYTAYNFGVLTRFKTPILPFYMGALIIMINNKKLA
ncbi:hypothetical protein V6R21_26485 [Limibacter armeniacum]|uniref:hypothetical protein n=1 Tax=Limibacter armeniacum TaxID=466084 RepID=UPI002FE5ADED